MGVDGTVRRTPCPACGARSIERVDIDEHWYTYRCLSRLMLVDALAVFGKQLDVHTPKHASN
jgi:hypothetical protein